MNYKYLNISQIALIYLTIIEPLKMSDNANVSIFQ